MLVKSAFAHTVMATIVLVFVFNGISGGASGPSTLFESSSALHVDKPPKREARIAFAKALLEEVDQIHGLIPNLSPTQKKWLDTQLSSNNSNRINKAYESDEFVLQTTKAKIGEIKIILEEIIEGNYLGQLMNQKKEVFNWLYVSTGLIDFYIPLGVAKLLNKKLISVPSDESFVEIDSLGLRFNAIGNSILTSIVGNYIDDKLPE
ncbi:MAG: hypothetical protein MRK02_15535 [Candidatus Scalindua sp.]|nr:hypothetical protein [Candidatus Scalindua sp.]